MRHLKRFWAWLADTDTIVIPDPTGDAWLVREPQPRRGAIGVGVPTRSP